MTDAPFTFEGCESPAACREGIRPLLGTGMDWSEVHCGRCGKRGIVRHADLDSAKPAATSKAKPAPAEPEAPAAAPAVEPEAKP
ncbi:hypothetical protein ACFQE0_14670 [Methylobacterium komagatae]|uniref:Uncharacterized protein n=1 Tax=Methylobacterium komagatae TaxID=374425 RepID=A0ABW2BLN7_9HYPH